jgi:hypothetical protein
VKISTDCQPDQSTPTSSLRCDDNNDCENGEICCSHYAASADFLTQECVPAGSCTTPDFQVCTQGCECASGKCNGGTCAP